MNNAWVSFSDQIAAAVERAAESVVQVHGHRRPAAGVVFADNHILTPAAIDDDNVAVHTGEGHTVEGVVLGRVGNMGLTVVRVEGLARPALKAAAEPRPGHLGVAVGRTWSGGVMASLAPVSVVGGPLRTGRASTLDRVIRIQQPPHGALTGGALVDSSGDALGIITSMAIRGTTVVIPASIAWAAGTRVTTEGGTRQGFLGVSSLAVAIPERQRGGRAQSYGLLVSQVASGSPAESGGVLVGDVIVAFDGETVQEPEELVIRLRGDRVGKAVPITVVRGGIVQDVAVTVGERPRG
ncbi:MAG: PDZ domain-containing protein [Acidobacteriota bacterium]|nr:PDZ domain-containing protein [Acidobacteriota bacterium]